MFTNYDVIIILTLVIILMFSCTSVNKLLKSKKPQTRYYKKLSDNIIRSELLTLII